MHNDNRRDQLIRRIESRCNIKDMGFTIAGNPSPCHLWTGPTSGKGRGGGYGRISINGVTSATHIVAFTHYHGYIPPSRQVDHLCNQRLCCNPQHLELVTHLKNQRRRVKRAKETGPHFNITIREDPVRIVPETLIEIKPGV